MKLHQIRDFLAVARSGSLRAASRDLELSQPSISKSIQQLESTLGAPLFERSIKGVSLTPFGEVFLTRGRAALNELQRAQEEIHQLRGVDGGQVSAALTGIPLMTLLPAALSRFRRLFPNANVRVVERRHDTTLADIREGTLDFAVMPSSTLPDGLVAEVILRDQNVVIGRCGHPLREVSSLRELLEASWVVTRRQGEQAAEFEANFLLQSLPAPKVEVHCESVVGVISLIVNSDLLGYLPRRWVTAGIGRDLLEEIPAGAPVEATPICLVRKAGMPLTPAAQAFANAITVEAEALAGPGEMNGRRNIQTAR